MPKLKIHNSLLTRSRTTSPIHDMVPDRLPLSSTEARVVQPTLPFGGSRK
jgi:hypothetical protein